MKKAACVCLVCFSLLLLCGCSEQKEQSITVFAMDTVMTMTVYGGDNKTLQNLTQEVQRLEGLFSSEKTGSEISLLNQNGSAELSFDTCELLRQSLEICRMTDGALDITVYPLTKAWGFISGDYRVPDEEESAQLMSLVGYDKAWLKDGAAWLKGGAEISLGSTAKGYTGAVLSKLLKDEGISSAVLDLGGNIQTVGSRPDGGEWRVGVKSPDGGILGVLSIRDMAVVTSGGYERYFEQDGQIYWHILDPKTGYPADSGLASVTIVGSDGTLCDGLSTAVFVMGRERAQELWRQWGGFEMLLLDSEGTIYITEGLEGSFEPESGLEVLVIKSEG